MKKLLLNPDLQTHLSFGGLFLIFLRTPLDVYDLVDKNSLLNTFILVIGILAILMGLILRFYHAKNDSLRSFVLMIGLGAIVILILFLTDTIKLPAL